jgi:NAD(P)-dependent dehydrogenase (short-subunit alcohol dehydrogenase family)
MDSVEGAVGVITGAGSDTDQARAVSVAAEIDASGGVLHAFLPQLLEQGRGHVVTTGSTAGLFPYAYDRLPYAATKAALIALTESLALYLRPRGIGVTCYGVGTSRAKSCRSS